MKEAKSDPVKKAGLIRDIVTSISKIPDGIQREVYVQECSRVMEISERVLFSELAQLLNKEVKPKRTQSNVDPNQPPPEYFMEQEAAMTAVKGGKVAVQKIDQLDLFEKEIIKILLLHGNEEIDFTQEVEVENDKGRILIEKESYRSLVSQELYLNLQEDEIEFANTLFKDIYYELLEQLNQEKKFSIEKLTNHKNSEISAAVTDILMESDEIKHPLSNWESKDIYVTETIKVLPKAVLDVVYRLRVALIGLKIKELLSEVSNDKVNNEALEEIMNYNTLKQMIFEKLNRVV